MDFDDRRFQRRERIEYSHRGVPIPGRIDDHAGCRLCPRLLNPIDDLALVVRLTKFDAQSVLCSGGPAQLFGVGERGVAVNLRLAQAKQIEIRSVEDVDRLRHARVTPRRSSRQVAAAGQLIGKAPAKGKPAASTCSQLKSLRRGNPRLMRGRAPGYFRSAPIFSRSASRPTAPTTTSSPTT